MLKRLLNKVIAGVLYSLVVMAMSVSGSVAEKFRLLILQAVHHMLKVRGTVQRLDPKCRIPNN